MPAKTVRAIVATALLSAALLSVTACNTTAGAGKDIQKTGEKMQDAADSAK